MTIDIFPTLNLLARPEQVPPALVFGRSGTATRVDAVGTLVAESADVLRHDFDRLSGVYRGWRLEGTRTNLLLNSLTPADQTVALGGGTYTLSVVGPGSATLSGTGSGTATEGAPFTFGTFGGSATITVSGTLQGFQLESGSYATSIIPTAGSQVTRGAETAEVPVSAFPLNPAEGTLYLECATAGHGGLQTALELGDGTAGERIVLRFDTNRVPEAAIFEAGMQRASILGPATVAGDQVVKLAFSYGAGVCALSIDGGPIRTASPSAIPTATSLWLGSEGTATDPLNGHIRHAAYFPRRVADADLQLLTR